MGAGISLSPDGRKLAFEVHRADTAANDYRTAWFVALTKSDAGPRNVGDAGEPSLFKSGAPGGQVNGAWDAPTALWSADSKWIVYRRKSGDQVQLWRSRVDGSLQEQITENAADVERFVWGKDERLLLFSTDAPRALLQEEYGRQAAAGYVFDYESGWATFHGRPYRNPYAMIGGKAKVWAYDWFNQEERPATADEIAWFERATSRGRQLDAVPTARRVALAPSDGAAAWFAPAYPDKQGISPPLVLHASTFVDGRRSATCGAVECTGYMETNELTAGPLWSDAEDEIYFTRREGPAYRTRVIYAWNPGHDTVHQVFQTDEWISGCERALSRLICFRQAPDYPRTIVSIDLVSGQMDTVVDPNPDFSNLRVGSVERISWKNTAGTRTYGYLVKPPDFQTGKRYPLVIAGYRARYAFAGGVGAECPVHPLAGNGFVVLVYERPVDMDVQSRIADVTELARHKWGRSAFDYRSTLSLLDTLVDQLAKSGIVDRNRVGMCGFSNGAHHVGYVLIHSNLLAAATMAWSEQSTSSYYVSGVPGWFRRDVQKTIGFGRPGSGSDWNWSNTSLALNAKKINAPLLVTSSDFEHIRALQDVVTLTELKRPVEMHVYPDEYHVKWQPAHRAAANELIYDWFNFWLRDVESSGAHKVDQYVRWRSLRKLQGDER